MTMHNGKKSANHHVMAPLKPRPTKTVGGGVSRHPSFLLPPTKAAKGSYIYFNFKRGRLNKVLEI